MITDFLNEKTIQLKVKAADREDAIRKAAACLVEEKKIKQDYIEQIWTVYRGNSRHCISTCGSR